MEEGLSEKEREHGSKGGRETSREVVYSQTNHSQTGPCPRDWVHMPWHGLDALQGTRAKPGNHLVTNKTKTNSVVLRIIRIVTRVRSTVSHPIRVVKSLVM